MAVIAAQVTYKDVSGLPENSITNTFHFGVAGYADAKGAAIVAALKAFYDTPGGSGQPPLFTFSPALAVNVDAGDRTIKLYDLSQAKPRVPVLEAHDAPAIGGGGSGGLPSEVALVLSFQAAKISGVHQASRRGRVFLGPLRMNASTGGKTPRPTGATIGGWLDAAQSLAAASAAAADWTWGVYSQKLHTFAPVHDAWCDDAFDTQRRRGLQPSSRSVRVTNAANAVVLAA